MHCNGKQSERGANYSGNLSVSKPGDVVHNCLCFGGCKRSVKSRLIAKSINSHGNIYRIGVSREEGGGIFEAMFLPARERQRQVNIDVIVAIEIRAAAARHYHCCTCHKPTF